ncbi:MAG: sigma-70 family RNA polymerase sigma factor [Armatimonadetes bacterium]|nr:sigma-70 family RNA polymerase sigma factor [Armatimonadota bacterium]
MHELHSAITRAQSGDLEAYGHLVQRFQDMACGYAYSILGDFDLAEDAAQDAFIQAYRELGSLREPNAFAGWFRRIVFTECSRLTRGKKLPTVPLESVLDVESAEPGPDRIVEQSEIRDAVLAAVRSLPEHERAVTTLFYINGYSHDDIAGFLDVPVSTVKSRLYTSRKRLKERMLEMVGDYLHENAPDEKFTSRVLENIPNLGWGMRKECTYCGALEAALSLTDHPFDYATIMGLNGIAFRTRWYQGPADYQRWCPSSCVGEFPEEDEWFLQSSGWRFRTEAHLNEKEPKMGRFGPDVVKSINAGWPVLAYDKTWNIAVIKGYEEGGKVVLLQTYRNPETEKHALDDLPGFLVIFKGHDKPLPPREQLMHSLRIAVRNWDRPNGLGDHMGRGGYLYGFRALKQWAEDLGRYDEWTEKERESLFFVSWWCFCSLVDARMAAVEYLRGHLDDVSGDERDSLARVISLYEEEINLLTPPSYERKEAFFGPWSGKSIADWTPEVRAREQELLLKATAIESDAVKAIEAVFCGKPIEWPPKFTDW